jgi:hypothetical protein
MSNKKKLIIYSVIAIVALTLGILLLKSLKSDESDTDSLGTDNQSNTFTALDVDTTKYVESVDDVTEDVIEEAARDNGEFKITVTEDENGNKEVTDVDYGYLSSMPDDDFSKTLFESDIQNNSNSYIFEGETYDKVFNYDTSLIQHEDVINMINKLCQDNELYETVTIFKTPYDSTDEDEDDQYYSEVYYYVVEINWDFYIIAYYPGEGTIAYRDETGMLANQYLESEEDIEWNDEDDEEWNDGEEETITEASEGVEDAE